MSGSSGRLLPCAVMIHVATVHYGSELWIDVQLSYLRRNLSEPFRTVTTLEAVPGDHDDKFDLVVPAIGDHAAKLNLLAGEIAATAAPDDLIMFLDGDAFPIADPMPLARKALEVSSLVAVRRDENEGEVQPHPCFCVVRVADWEALHGDWSPGYRWTTATGRQITDVGGNLLRCLERNNAEWTPILRSNRVDLHPLFFGVYGDVVYHQGAGFRSGFSRADSVNRPIRWGHSETPSMLDPVLGAVYSLRRGRYRRRVEATMRPVFDEMIRRVQQDPEFYRTFI
jgi:hypothetical protein